MRRGGTYVAVACSLLLCGPAAAHAGDLDPSFGAAGVASFTNSHPDDKADVVQDARGGLIVTTGSVISRFTGDGALDRRFNRNARPVYGAGEGFFKYGDAVAVGPDRRIAAVSGGEGSLAIVRLMPNGKPDESFGRRGILFVGFGRRGRPVRGWAPARGGNPRAIAVDSRRRILVGGSETYSDDYGASFLQGFLLRLKPDGDLDRSFGDAGSVRFARRGVGEIGDVEVLPSGKLMVTAATHSRFLLARLLSDGRLDPSFGGGDGKIEFQSKVDQPWDSAGTLAVGRRGRITFTGSRSYKRSTTLVRVTRRGTLDRSFSGDGVLSARGIYGSEVAEQLNGRVVMAETGRRHTTVVRYESSGEPDESLGSSGRRAFPRGLRGWGRSVLIQRDGLVVVTAIAQITEDEDLGDAYFLGRYDLLLARLLPR